MKVTMTVPRTTRADAALATCAGLVGLMVRIGPVLTARFPLNDGGLFYRMILDLQANHFHLPLFTTYNRVNVPFAYPPLALYVTGVLATVLNVQVLTLLRFVPAVASALSVPVFYFLTRQILNCKDTTALAATLAFALVPRGFEWQIMGGGITRSLGFLFALLTLRSLHSLFVNRSPKSLPASILWGSLTVVSHPEAALQTAILGIVLYLARDRTWKGATYGLAAGAGIAALSSPWWALVLSRHGLDPFVAAFNAAGGISSPTLAARIFAVLQPTFTGEPFLPIIAFLGLLGAGAELGRREYLLPLWIAAPLLIEPRSAPQFTVIPLAMLAGVALMDVVVPALQKGLAAESRNRPFLPMAVLAYVFLFSLLSAYVAGSRISLRFTLDSSDLRAFTWVREQTSPTSRFAIVSGGVPLRDATSEWFPAITGRQSMATVFGSEWIPGSDFANVVSRYEALQNCGIELPACLQTWKRTYNIDFDYVYIRETDGAEPSPLAQLLTQSTDYDPVYTRDTISIFKRKSAAVTPTTAGP